MCARSIILYFEVLQEISLDIDSACIILCTSHMESIMKEEFAFCALQTDSIQNAISANGERSIYLLTSAKSKTLNRFSFCGHFYSFWTDMISFRKVFQLSVFKTATRGEGRYSSKF